ncbi:DUF7283 family protein [Haloarcula salina]|uniref:Uncharacterized protein n=1 Tax=Haloarcula salina TaxID=1429914 RepID=A0AA41G0S5_9EURY|nr:hypothetical protein [Haloarcula salina]MBV0901474.1 hypothetical protein [Haloarcula salina]
MFETHVDALYLWVGLSAVSVAVLGVVAGLPMTAPPNATATAATIDEVATSPPGSVEKRRLLADEWALEAGALRLRNDGGTAQAGLTQYAVAADSERLRTVLDGTAPASVYDSPAAFRAALDRARARNETWRPAPERLSIGHVAWGGVDVTLVG